MFASPTVSRHLGRGLLGGAALAAAVALNTQHPWLSLAFLPVALWAFRGCPMCWTLGLVETVVARLQRRPARACASGQCSRER